MSAARFHPLIALLFLFGAVYCFYTMRLQQRSIKEIRMDMAEVLIPLGAVHHLVGREIDLQHFDGVYEISRVGGVPAVRWRGIAVVRHRNGETSRVPLQVQWREANASVTLYARAFGQAARPTWRGLMFKEQLGHQFAERIMEHRSQAVSNMVGVLLFACASCFALFFDRVRNERSKKLRAMTRPPRKKTLRVTVPIE